MNRTAIKDVLKLGAEVSEWDAGFCNETDLGAFVVEETAGGGETEGAGDAGVVAELWMDVEWEVSAVDGKAGLQAEAELLMKCSGDGLQSSPKQAVMDDEKVSTSRYRFANDWQRGIDSSGDGFDLTTWGIDLQTVQGRGIVGNRADLEFGIEMGDEVGEEHERWAAAICSSCGGVF